MRDLTGNFDNLKIDYAKLKAYGFKKNKNDYSYEANIGKFKAIIQINDKTQSSKLIDSNTNEEYILVDLKTTLGEYASKIKEEYDNLIKDIIEKCTTKNVFKSKQAMQIIKYIKQKYNDELEFLWDSLDAAIWRNKDSAKWYGLLMQVDAQRLGFKEEKLLEIINLHYQKDKVNEVINNKTIIPGYHMNKKSWISIILDNDEDINLIYQLIDNSYALAKK